MVASENGKVVVLKADPQWEILAIHDFGEDIFATPAMDESGMYLRTMSTLYRIGTNNPPYQGRTKPPSARTVAPVM